MQERVGGGVGAGSKKWQGVGSSRPLGPRLGLGGGSKSFGAGGPQGRSKFRNLRRIFDVSNAYKKKEMTFFEGCPVGWGGTPCVVFLTFLTRIRRKMIFFEGYPVGWGGVQGLGRGGSKGFGAGGVGGRGTFATCVAFLTLKDNLWGGGAYKGSGGEVQGLWFRGGRW